MNWKQYEERKNYILEIFGNKGWDKSVLNRRYLANSVEIEIPLEPVEEAAGKMVEEAA